MTPQAGLLLSAVAFVGSHLLLSHPLRRPLARRLGERAFQGLYSLIAFATLGRMIYFYWAIGDEPPLAVGRMGLDCRCATHVARLDPAVGLVSE